MGGQPAPTGLNGKPVDLVRVSEPEAMLVKTLIEISRNRLAAALEEIDKVIEEYPNFRLAHLIKG
ncbi:MAG: hypothetical protein HY323_18880, partial [Betaproteobacteria bacterium]|nr:hypothetical protein [Betaproteobacteria bacterium]